MGIFRKQTVRAPWTTVLLVLLALSIAASSIGFAAWTGANKQFEEINLQYTTIAIPSGLNQEKQYDAGSYEALCSGIMRQLESEEVFLRAKDQYDRMKMLGYDYVCQIGYERLLGSEGQRDAVILTIQLMIALILGLSSIHSIETESNMVFLLNSVPGKQNSLRVKTILATVYAIAAAVITFVPHLLVIIHAYGLPGLSASGNSVPLLRMGTHTVFGGLCIYAAAIICLAILAAHVVSLISKKTGNITGTIIMSSVLLIPLVCIIIVI